MIRKFLTDTKSAKDAANSVPPVTVISKTKVLEIRWIIQIESGDSYTSCDIVKAFKGAFHFEAYVTSTKFLPDVNSVYFGR